MAVDESRNSLTRRHALIQYRRNLDNAIAYARAWRHGGMLFFVLCMAAFVASVIGIWQTFPGENLIPWVTPVLSFLAVYMSGRASRLLRDAMAGYPARPR